MHFQRTKKVKEVSRHEKLLVIFVHYYIACFAGGVECDDGYQLGTDKVTCEGMLNFACAYFGVYSHMYKCFIY